MHSIFEESYKWFRVASIDVESHPEDKKTIFWVSDARPLTASINNSAY